MAKLDRENNLGATIGAVNEAILRASSEETLFEGVCDAAISDGEFIGAAVLLAGADNWLRIAAFSASGVELAKGYIAAAFEEDFEVGRGIAATVFRSGQPAITDGRLYQFQAKRPHAIATRIGAQSVGAAVIKRGKISIGILIFFLAECGTCGKMFRDFLEKTAENISFALENCAREQQLRQAEQASERLARMFAALSASNEAIMRAGTRAELYQQVCEAAVIGGNFASAGIGFVEGNAAFIDLSATAGPAGERMKGIRVSLDASTPEGRRLGAIACSTKQPCVSNDCLVDERLVSLRSMFIENKVRAVGAWPLIRDGQAIGIFMLQSYEAGLFTPDLIELLQRLADNLIFALTNFDRADEKKKADDRIQYLATHDGLTGLPNRAMFSQLLQQSIELSRRHARQFALLFIDLDRFKIINDTLGHAAGDSLLIEIGQRLCNAVRASDVVARLGGDEFVVLLQEIGGDGDVATIAENILSAVMRPLVLSGQECRVTASIGVAMFPADGEDEQTLTKNADTAMYCVKTEGKNAVRVFSEDMKTQSIEQLMLETGLRHALERDEFVLHYQPKRNLSTGKIVGVEALIRWAHPDLGLLQPNQFISLAEETGLIIPIGQWVLRTACKQNMAWQRQGLMRLSMAVNLSPRQFTNEHLLDDIDRALAESGMAPEFLELEITESMVMHDVKQAIQVLGAIKSRGVRLAMDDFGTGYSSMSLIKQFPVDTLKIDRSFIRDLAQNADDKAIADAVIALGKALGLTVIAEGVETAEQEHFLREHACDQMQGFLCSKAVPAEELLAFLLPHHSSPSLELSGPVGGPKRARAKA